MDFTPYFTKLANADPILGVLLVIALGVIGYLFHMFVNEKDRSITKAEQMNVTLRSVNDTMRELLLEIEKRPYDDPYEKKRKKA